MAGSWPPVDYRFSRMTTLYSGPAGGMARLLDGGALVARVGGFLGDATTERRR